MTHPSRSLYGLGAAGVLVLSLGSAAKADPVLFSDTFNANTPALNVDPLGWTVSDGTVDIITDFGSCPSAAPAEMVPGGGCIIDLDGSTGDSGLLSNSVSLDAAETYSLVYYLRGGLDDNKVTVQFGSSVTSLAITSGSSWARYVLANTPAAAGIVSFSFENQGGDNMGVYLDNVSVVKGVVADVPAPLPLAAAAAAWSTSRRIRQRLR
ncbi:MAG: hypothetical protein ACKOZW_02920 [Cyanobium sp.]